MSLALRTDARLWAQGGATVSGLERARPPLGPRVGSMSPRQGGPGAAKGPPWTRARPRSARLRRTKASLVGRGLQEAPFATIVTGRSCPKLGPSLAGAWRRLGVGVEWGGAKTASPPTQCRTSHCGPRAAGDRRPQPVERESLVHCMQRNAGDSRDPAYLPWVPPLQLQPQRVCVPKGLAQFKMGLGKNSPDSVNWEGSRRSGDIFNLDHHLRK